MQDSVTEIEKGSLERAEHAHEILERTRSDRYAASSVHLTGGIGLHPCSVTGSNESRIDQCKVQ